MEAVESTNMNTPSKSTRRMIRKAVAMLDVLEPRQLLAWSVANPGFEDISAGTQTPAGWSESGTVSASFIEGSGGGGGPRSGSYKGTHWASGSYDVTTYQTVTGLDTGYYTLSAWTRKSSTQTAKMRASGYDAANAAAKKEADLPQSSSYQQILLRNVYVNSGQLTIGFQSTASGGAYAFFDDVALTYVGATLDAPAAPTNFAVSSFTPYAISLSWTDNSTVEERYILDRATDSAFTQNLVSTTLAIDATSTTVSSLTPSTTYYFRLRAENVIGPSAYAGPISQKTLQLVAPEAPSGLWVRGQTDTVLNLGWTDNAGYEDAVILDRADDASFTQNVVSTTLAANTTTHSATGLQANRKYYFRVSMRNSAGTSPLTPVLQTWTLAAPATGTNLLTVNPSFESVSSADQNYHGNLATTTTVGWTYSYDSYGWVQNFARGNATNGDVRGILVDGGTFRTTADARANVTAGRQYQLVFDARKTRDSKAWTWNGVQYWLYFYDSAGTVVKKAYTQEQLLTGTYPWQTLTLTAVAPAGAVKAGVEVFLSRGPYPDTDAQTIEIDNFRLYEVPETSNTVLVRQAPRQLEPGRTSSLKVEYTAKANAQIAVRLMKGTAVVGESRQSILQGRGTATLQMPVRPTAAAGEDYWWDVRMVPTGGVFTSSLARATSGGAFVDQGQTGSGSIAPTNANLVYSGRWDFTNPSQPGQYWGGSQIRTRFAGTSVKIKLSNPGYATVSYRAIIDGNENAPYKFTLAAYASQTTLTIATGLTDTVHSIVITRDGEATDAGVTFHGLELDAGKGTLRPEPEYERRIEFYGDSVTSGGNAGEANRADPDINNEGHWSGSMYRDYAMITARELSAEPHIMSKGGTAIEGSWTTGISGGLAYWDAAKYTVWDNSKASWGKWNFSQWTPQAVVIAYGQNDQFRNPDWAGTFKTFYTQLRQVYGPNVHIFATNSTMTGNSDMWDRIGRGLQATDPNFHYQTYPSHNSGHPTYYYHRAMALGGTNWNSLADWISSYIAPATPVGPRVTVDSSGRLVTLQTQPQTQTTSKFTNPPLQLNTWVLASGSGLLR